MTARRRASTRNGLALCAPLCSPRIVACQCGSSRLLRSGFSPRPGGCKLGDYHNQVNVREG